jgi:hypothetical protein
VSLADRQDIGRESEPVIVRPGGQHTVIVSGMATRRPRAGRQHFRANDH